MIQVSFWTYVPNLAPKQTNKVYNSTTRLFKPARSNLFASTFKWETTDRKH